MEKKPSLSFNAHHTKGLFYVRMQSLIAWLDACSWHQLSTIAQPWTAPVSVLEHSWPTFSLSLPVQSSLFTSLWVEFFISSSFQNVKRSFSSKRAANYLEITPGGKSSDIFVTPGRLLPLERAILCPSQLFHLTKQRTMRGRRWCMFIRCVLTAVAERELYAERADGS